MPTENTSSVSTAEDWSNIQLGGLNDNQFRGDEVETCDLELGKAFQLCEYFKVTEYKIHPHVEKQVYFFRDPLALPCTVMVLKRSATRLMDRATKAKAKIDPPLVLESDAYPDETVTPGDMTSLTRMEANARAQGADRMLTGEDSLINCYTKPETTVCTRHKPTRRHDSFCSEEEETAKTISGTTQYGGSTLTAY